MTARVIAKQMLPLSSTYASIGNSLCLLAQQLAHCFSAYAL